MPVGDEASWALAGSAASTKIAQAQKRPLRKQIASHHRGAALQSRTLCVPLGAFGCRSAIVCWPSVFFVRKSHGPHGRWFRHPELKISRLSHPNQRVWHPNQCTAVEHGVYKAPNTHSNRIRTCSCDTCKVKPRLAEAIFRRAAWPHEMHQPQGRLYGIELFQTNMSELKSSYGRVELIIGQIEAARSQQRRSSCSD